MFVTPRLVLRPIALNDGAALHQCLGDAACMRYFDDPHQDMAQSERWVADTCAAPRDKTREFVLVRDGVVIGKAGIWKAPELGFFLHPDHWRQGLMTEALTVLLPHLFNTLALEHINADVDPRNTASLRLLRSFGFQETGSATTTIKIANEWCDSVYLSCAAPSNTA